ncbi:DUF7260 family protein [Halorubrum sp. DTA46]|uniref:DUF7260 family protein n=1 Tax=Halorubrum sp. DTA46 TaxID=3402162 RepID=UPI003AAB8A34
MTTDPSGDDPADVLRAARQTLRVERRRTVDEREAFEAFRTRVRRVSTGTATGTDPRLRSDGSGAEVDTAGGFGAPGRLGRLPGTDRGAVAGSPLVAIRDAYADTVMSVPHYEAEYDDTYESSLAAEFGPDLAVALTREPTLDDRSKSALLSETDEAIEERERLLDALDTESESIDRAADRLCSILGEIATLSGTDRSELGFGALDAYRVRTLTLREGCDSVAARRQRELAGIGRSLRLSDAVPDLATYLYHDLPVTYPVLATVGAVGDRLEGLRRSIERALIRRR